MIKLADVNQIPEGGSIEVLAPDGREIALFKVEGQIYALDNRCPHMGGPLGEGELTGCMVTCPWHGWQFDVRTGVCENMPGDDASPIAIEVRDGQVFLNVSQ
jgi:nitrite reductase/ring-hydroxylating ferredoxin subunit